MKPRPDFVRSAISLLIGHSLTYSALYSFRCAFCVINTQGRTFVIAKNRTRQGSASNAAGYRALCSARARNARRLTAVRRGPRALAAHFSGDPSIKSLSHHGFKFRGFYARARVVVQGRSLPRPGEEPGLVQLRAAWRCPVGQPMNHATLARGPQDPTKPPGDGFINERI